MDFIAFSNIPDMFVIHTYNMFSNLQNIPGKSENQIVQNVFRHSKQRLNKNIFKLTSEGSQKAF